MRGETRPLRLEPAAELGFKVAGDREDNRRWRVAEDLVDEGQLPLRVQGRLEQDDIALDPGLAAGGRRGKGFGDDPEPASGEEGPLGKHEIVLDHEEPPGHGWEDSLPNCPSALLAIAKVHLPLL